MEIYDEIFHEGGRGVSSSINFFQFVCLKTAHIT